jgi:hypothetical protein
VDGGDGRLQLVGAGRPAGQGAADQVHALGDLCGVPPAPVLFGHGDQLTVRAGPRRPAGVGQQHEREEPGHLTVFGEQPVHEPGQPDRLGGQLGTVQARPGRAGVALGEDEIEHVQDRREPSGAFAGGGQPERRRAGLDLLLGPGDPPGHGRLGDKERPGDLRSGQAADRAEGQCDLRGRGQGGVTAHEQQDQGVVVVRGRPVGRRGQPVIGQLPAGHGVLAAPAGLIGPEHVGEPA